MRALLIIILSRSIITLLKLLIIIGIFTLAVIAGTAKGWLILLLLFIFALDNSSWFLTL